MKPSLLLMSAASLALSLSAAAEAQRESRFPGRDGPGGGREAMMMLRAADADGDNIVTRAEVDQLRRETFEWMDRNGDGVLTIADRSPVHQRMARIREEENADRPRFPRGLRGIRGRRDPVDADGNGEVSYDEFMAHESPLFERLDANSDDRITPDELDAAVERRRNRGFWWRD